MQYFGFTRIVMLWGLI